MVLQKNISIFFKMTNNNLLEYFLLQSKEECVFCNPCKELVVSSSANFTLMLDPFGLLPGHMLLTSHSHYGCLGEVPEHLQEECEQLRAYGVSLLEQLFGKHVTRYEHGRAGHCISRNIDTRLCHHYHEHLLPAFLSLHPILEKKFQSIPYYLEAEIVQLFFRYHEYLLVAESNGNKRFYIANTNDTPPHLLRSLAAQALEVEELENWESSLSCNNMLIGKERLQAIYQPITL